MNAILRKLGGRTLRSTAADAIVPGQIRGDKNAAIPSPACADYGSGANSFRPTGNWRSEDPPNRHAADFHASILPRRAPRTAFAACDEPDFIVSGWGWVSTNWRNPLVLQSLQSLKSAGRLQRIWANKAAFSLLDFEPQRLGECRLRALRSPPATRPGPRPSVAASTSTSPSAPSKRATSRRFCRTTIDVAPGCRAVIRTMSVAATAVGADAVSSTLLSVVVDHHRQNQPAARFDGVGVDGDDAQFVIAVRQFRGVELRRAAGAKRATSRPSTNSSSAPIRLERRRRGDCLDRERALHFLSRLESLDGHFGQRRRTAGKADRRRSAAVRPGDRLIKRLGERAAAGVVDEQRGQRKLRLQCDRFEDRAARAGRAGAQELRERRLPRLGFQHAAVAGQVVADRTGQQPRARTGRS